MLGVCYGALQNLTLVVAFAAVEPPHLAAASAGWNIGFDAGTGLGSVLAGALAAAYSFPVSLATLAALCLLAVRVALVPVRAAGPDLVPDRPTPRHAALALAVGGGGEHV